VKTRVGFESAAEFDVLLPIFQRHAIDLLTVHGRTVLQMYRPGVRRDLIAQAAAALPCPVLANGDVTSAQDVAEIMATTRVAGVMLGRSAIRNPWIFDQTRSYLRGEEVVLPTGRELLGYIHDLYENVTVPDTPESAQVNKLKKYMNFLGEGLPRAAEFLHGIRRATDRSSFFAVCFEHLDHGDRLSLVPSGASSYSGHT
jgi:tRNA-dihydrouridine synthase